MIQNNPWNERYSIEEYYYGEEPNEFLKENILKLKPGKILFPGEGEGRNAVFAARLGFDVTAFDSSSEAMKKALKLAEKHSVNINYKLLDYQSFIVSQIEAFQFAALIFTHCMPEIRTKLHKKIANLLLPGGMLILEAFNKKQLRNSSGGPNDINLLFSKEDLINDFASLNIVYCEEIQSKLSEGPHHEGTADVVRFLGIKQ